MPLFQASVLKKFLSQQNTAKINTAYAEYSAYFHNGSIQHNIRNSKEEQFQEGFLRELFVTILGDTLNPTPTVNLTTEYKNIKDSKKADGAIFILVNPAQLKKNIRYHLKNSKIGICCHMLILSKNSLKKSQTFTVRSS